MACGDGPSSFEERMNALRNRVESWKSTRASTDGVTPMKLRGAYEASQWPPTPDFRARTEFAEKEEFFFKIVTACGRSSAARFRRTAVETQSLAEIQERNAIIARVRSKPFESEHSET
mmetsp:Transcript_97124/g.153771  ORF Transcript_97124/g.153771 Transcript_97124/m.153771 type:complete len:118 (-) Transcript_97124:700-1053(-)